MHTWHKQGTCDVIEHQKPPDLSTLHRTYVCLFKNGIPFTPVHSVFPLCPPFDRIKSVWTFVKCICMDLSSMYNYIYHNCPPLCPMKIELLVSEESSHIFLTTAVTFWAKLCFIEML